MNTKTIAELISLAWQTNTKTITFPDGSIAVVPAKPDGMRDEWIESLIAVALFCT